MKASTPTSRAADRQRISELDGQIAQLQSALNVLESERELLHDRLAEFVYPVLTLPTETVTEIFEQYLPAYPACPPLLGDGSPTKLAGICRLWRDVALSTASLWRSIHLDFSSVHEDDEIGAQTVLNTTRTWLNRSRSMALSIVFTDRNQFLQIEDLAVAAIFDHCARWEYVNFSLPTTLSEGMRQAIREMPLLVELQITSYTSAESVLGRFDSPRLRRVDARLSHDPLYLQLFSNETWAQLTTLKLADIPSWIAQIILTQTTNLVHCWLMLWKETETEAGPSDKLYLPHLKTLLLTSERCRRINELLRSLVLPSLRTLAIEEIFVSELSDDPHHPDPVNSLSRVLRTWTPRPLERLYILSPAVVHPDEYRAAFPEIDPGGLNFYEGPKGSWEAPHDIWLLDRPYRLGM